jgi:hypothetical protein
MPAAHCWRQPQRESFVVQIAQEDEGLRNRGSDHSPLAHVCTSMLQEAGQARWDEAAAAAGRRRIWVCGPGWACDTRDTR